MTGISQYGMDACQVQGANNFDIYEIITIIESSFYVIDDDASENLYRKEMIAYALVAVALKRMRSTMVVNENRMIDFE